MGSQHTWRIRHLWSVLLLLTAATLVPLTVATARPSAPFGLSWKVVDNAANSSRAVFTLTNTSPKPIPATGWSIYFTSIAGVRPVSGGAVVKHIVGSLYSVRPAPGDATTIGVIAPGASIRLYVEHSELMIMSDKGPTGPYVVFDDHPADGLTVGDYERLPIERTSHLPGVPGDVCSMVSPEAIYAANADIRDISSSNLPPIFPTPLSVERGTGGLRLESLPRIIAPRRLSAEGRFARAMFSSYALPRGKGGMPIRLRLGEVQGQISKDAYRLVIDPRAGIVITGKSPAGVYFGLQSLSQLLPDADKKTGGAVIPALTVVDAPRFAYRGLMMDVARNFQSKEKVFAVIDLMARYKLNRLHLHLTDDEGWRLEIPRLPELTDIGGRRGHSVDWADRLPPAYGSGPDVGDSHGSGFYSAEDYVAILTYAKARHIEVVPEIEMPGHARAAVRAMEARARNQRLQGNRHAGDYLLNDPQDRSVYESAQGYSDNVIDPGLESSYRFIEVVVDQVAALHHRAGVPLHRLHIGADELADGAWEGSPSAQHAMSQLPGHSTADLWDRYYDRVNAILNRHGIKAAGWEELGVRKTRTEGRTLLSTSGHFLDRGITLFVWNNLGGSQDLAYRLANAGYGVVMAPATSLYFDMAYSRDAAELGHNWAAYTDLKDVYNFNPLSMTGTDAEGSTSLSPKGRANLVGLEATLFSETMREPQRIDYMVMPRLLGLAERAWGPEPAWARESNPEHAGELHAEAWSMFVNQVGKRLLPRLDADMPGFNYRLPPPGLKREGGTVLVNSQFPGLIQRYTVDGSLPNETSPQVSGPISDHGTITVSTFSRSGRAGRTSSLINH